MIYLVQLPVAIEGHFRVHTPVSSSQGDVAAASFRFPRDTSWQSGRTISGTAEEKAHRGQVVTEEKRRKGGGKNLSVNSDQELYKLSSWCSDPTLGSACLSTPWPGAQLLAFPSWHWQTGMERSQLERQSWWIFCLLATTTAVLSLCQDSITLAKHTPASPGGGKSLKTKQNKTRRWAEARGQQPQLYCHSPLHYSHTPT